MDAQHRQILNDLRRHGVRFDDLFLLTPDLEHAERVHNKISPSFAHTKRAIDRARHEGKHVLYVPGSYDLVHAGHAFHIQLAIEQYLAQSHCAGMDASDLFVVALADDDALIAAAKASKYIGNGGTEKFRRPIQSADAQKIKRELGNWRLYELASLPTVNLVGMLPSPITVEDLAMEEILAAQCDREYLAEHFVKERDTGAILPVDQEILEQAIDQYDALVTMIDTQPAMVVSAFEQNTHPWSIQAWQLFNHRYLGSGTFDVPLVRIVSEEDVVYRAQVTFLMRVSDIEVFSISEPLLLSTSDLIAQHGSSALIAAKERHWASHPGAQI